MVPWYLLHPPTIRYNVPRHTGDSSDDRHLEDGFPGPAVGHARRRGQGAATPAEGINVFDYSLGEPDFNTPEHIRAAAVAAMNKGQTHYTPADGTPEARAAVCRYYQRNYGLDIAPTSVLLSNGAKHSIHNALASTVGPGDEVIIPTPYWVSYSDLVTMTGATYKLVPTTLASGFKMTARAAQGRHHAALEAAHDQLAVQPDRGGLLAGRTGGDRRRRPGQQPRRPQR